MIVEPDLQPGRRGRPSLAADEALRNWRRAVKDANTWRVIKRIRAKRRALRTQAKLAQVLISHRDAFVMVLARDIQVITTGEPHLRTLVAHGQYEFHLVEAGSDIPAYDNLVVRLSLLREPGRKYWFRMKPGDISSFFECADPSA